MTWVKNPDHLSRGKLEAELDAKCETHESNEYPPAGSVHRRWDNGRCLEPNARISDIDL